MQLVAVRGADSRSTTRSRRPRNARFRRDACRPSRRPRPRASGSRRRCRMIREHVRVDGQRARRAVVVADRALRMKADVDHDVRADQLRDLEAGQAPSRRSRRPRRAATRGFGRVQRAARKPCGDANRSAARGPTACSVRARVDETDVARGQPSRLNALTKPRSADARKMSMRSSGRLGIAMRRPRRPSPSGCPTRAARDQLRFVDPTARSRACSRRSSAPIAGMLPPGGTTARACDR